MSQGSFAGGVLDLLEARDLTQLLAEICHRRGVVAQEVCGRGRSLGVCRARQELWWQIRHHPEREYSYSEIARLFGRDHTTIQHGVAAHARRSCR